MRYIPPKPRFIRLVARTVNGPTVYTGGRAARHSRDVIVARVIRRNVSH